MFARRFAGEPIDDLRTDDTPAMADDPDTSIADYVWLPLRFEGDMAFIDWHDEWRIENFE